MPVDDGLWTVYGHWYRVAVLTASAAAVLAYLADTVELFVSGGACVDVFLAVSLVPGVGLLGYRGV